MGASNLTERKSLRDEIIAVVSVDGIVKAATRGTKTKWDESFDIPLEKALEVEISIFEKNGPIVGLIWFKLIDLEEDLSIRNAKNNGVDVPQAICLELEPSGRLLTKINLVQSSKKKSQKDIFRRNNVAKVYPRNGHLFITKEFYQVLKCAICNEFLGRRGYQCENCCYTVHPKCYNRVITKCIPLNKISQVNFIF